MYTIYGQPGCQYCERALEVAKGYGSYQYIDISESASAQFYIKETLGAKTVPQIFHDDKHIGGYEDLLDHIVDNWVMNQMFDKGDLF